MESDLLNAWLDAVNGHDGESLAALMTDEGIYEIVPTGQILTVDTVGQAITLTRAMSSDYAVSLVSGVEVSGMYAAEWIVTGTNDGSIPYLGLPASGRPFTIRAAAVGRTLRGKIERHTEYWDAGAFLAQLGIPPPAMVEFALAAMTEEPIDS